MTTPNPPALMSVHKTIRAATLRTIGALVLREMSVTYGRAPGGYIWIVLEPVLGIALLSAIFSLGFRSPRLGDNFPMFYATGILPFVLFNDISARVANSINFSRSLLNYPRVTFIDAMVARLVLAILSQLLVTYIILVGIQMIWDTRTTLEIGRVLMAISMAIVLGMGVGSLNCFLFTMFPLWQRAWVILTRPLFLVSGILILYESLPETIRHWFWWNPLMHVTGEMRGAFYLEYEATYVSYAYVFACGMIPLVLGLLFLRQYHRDMLER
ncbi:MAG: ABC transporter permease [Jannaschia sp.]